MSLPIQWVFELTRRCNLSCWCCYAMCDKHTPTMSGEMSLTVAQVQEGLQKID